MATTAEIAHPETAVEPVAERRRAPTEITVGLAQIDCRLGDVDANVARHLEWIARARAAGADLLVFPELSLTGYRLLHLTPRVAIHPESDPRIARLAEAAGPMAVVLGAVEEDRRGVLRNSALLLQSPPPPEVPGDSREAREVPGDPSRERRVPGGAREVPGDSRPEVPGDSPAGPVPAFRHHKVYLPTYGIFQEERFFGAAGGWPCRGRPSAGRAGGSSSARTSGTPVSPRASRRPEPSSSSCPRPRPAASVRDPSRRAARAGRRSPARRPSLNTCWVVYCNRVGWEEGSFYPGDSHVVRPGGEVVARAPLLEEHLLLARIDLREADRLRWRLPLVDDERSDVRGPEEPE